VQGRIGWVTFFYAIFTIFFSCHSGTYIKAVTADINARHPLLMFTSFALYGITAVESTTVQISGTRYYSTQYASAQTRFITTILWELRFLLRWLWRLRNSGMLTPSSLVETCWSFRLNCLNHHQGRRFRWTCCLHHHGVSFLMTEAVGSSEKIPFCCVTRRHIQEDSGLVTSSELCRDTRPSDCCHLVCDTGCVYCGL